MVKVVALDTDDKVVQNNAHASPHDDDHVAPCIDKLDLDLLQRLERRLQQAHRVLNSYTYL